jgi:hypothetical protein
MTRGGEIRLHSGPDAPYTALLRQAVSVAAGPAEHRHEQDHEQDQEHHQDQDRHHQPPGPLGASLSENANP